MAIGITNQRESTVVWDRNTGEPLVNAIIWMDNRTTSTVEDLLETIPNNARNINYLRPLCGLPLSPYFSGVKLRWLRDNVATVKKAMDAGDAWFGTIDTWLMYNLTGGKDGGVHKTDVTNASRTMLMNIETLQWDPNLLKFFGLPKSILPEICSSAEHYGYITSGLLKGISIAADLGDQQAALVGQQCLSKGQAKATFGTGCFLLYNTGPSIVHSQHGLLTTVGYQLGRKASPFYALEGSVSIAGAAFNWLRDNMGIIHNTGEIEAMANTVDNSLDVYFVPAFNGLYAPYWNQDARGVICGLSEETTSEHIVRATLEAVCFQVRDILDSMHKDCKIPLAKLMVDGGMTVNNLFLQLQSDLVGIQVLRAKIAETTALVSRLLYNPSYPKLIFDFYRVLPWPPTRQSHRNIIWRVRFPNQRFVKPSSRKSVPQSVIYAIRSGKWPLSDPSTGKHPHWRKASANPSMVNRTEKHFPHCGTET